MDITTIYKELRALIMLTERWQEQGYTPAIERDIALGRIRNVYDKLLEIAAITNCDPTKPNEKEQQIIDIISGKVAQNDPDEDDDDFGDEDLENQNNPKQAEQEPEQDPEQDPEQEPEQEPEQKQKELQQRRFIHDLFCNDETFYNQEISKLSALTSMDDILIYIGEKYAWAPGNVSAQEFVELQSKRFD